MEARLGEVVELGVVLRSAVVPVRQEDGLGDEAEGRRGVHVAIVRRTAVRGRTLAELLVVQQHVRPHNHGEAPLLQPPRGGGDVLGHHVGRGLVLADQLQPLGLVKAHVEVLLGLERIDRVLVDVEHEFPRLGVGDVEARLPALAARREQLGVGFLERPGVAEPLHVGHGLNEVRPGEIGQLADVRRGERGGVGHLRMARPAHFAEARAADEDHVQLHTRQHAAHRVPQEIHLRARAQGEHHAPHLEVRPVAHAQTGQHEALIIPTQELQERLHCVPCARGVTAGNDHRSGPHFEHVPVRARVFGAELDGPARQESLRFRVRLSLPNDDAPSTPRRGRGDRQFKGEVVLDLRGQALGRPAVAAAGDDGRTWRNGERTLAHLHLLRLGHDQDTAVLGQARAPRVEQGLPLGRAALSAGDLLRSPLGHQIGEGRAGLETNHILAAAHDRRGRFNGVHVGNAKRAPVFRAPLAGAHVAQLPAHLPLRPGHGVLVGHVDGELAELGD